MRLGIGGGAFGVRGGISTRGIGVGVGPLSAGTSWRGGSRRRSGDGGFIGFAITAIGIFLVVAWPYLLGTFVAVQIGAGNPSAARTAAGWIFEILYIGGAGVWFVATRGQRARAAATRDQAARELAASGGRLYRAAREFVGVPTRLLHCQPPIARYCSEVLEVVKMMSLISDSRLFRLLIVPAVAAGGLGKATALAPSALACGAPNDDPNILCPRDQKYLDDLAAIGITPKATPRALEDTANSICGDLFRDAQRYPKASARQGVKDGVASELAANNPAITFAQAQGWVQAAVNDRCPEDIW